MEEPPLSLFSDDDEEAGSSPRISFSSEFLDESNFITICPNPEAEREREVERARAAMDFEFGNLTNNKIKMMSADELISEGKLLPFWQTKIHHAEKLNMIMTLKSDGGAEEASITKEIEKEEGRIRWSFIDDDPSPRPPSCTVLWKELLRLKKQRHPLTLSPSTSSSSSSTSSSTSVGEEIRKERNKEKGSSKRIINCREKEKEKEKTRSVSIRIRPVLNVAICKQTAKNAALPPLFSLMKKGR